MAQHGQENSPDIGPQCPNGANHHIEGEEVSLLLRRGVLGGVCFVRRGLVMGIFGGAGGDRR